MAPLVKCLAHKHGDLSSAPQHLHKSQVWWKGLKHQCGEAESLRLDSLDGQVSSRFRERPSLKERGGGVMKKSTLCQLLFLVLLRKTHTQINRQSQQRTSLEHLKVLGTYQQIQCICISTIGFQKPDKCLISYYFNSSLSPFFLDLQ